MSLEQLAKATSPGFIEPRIVTFYRHAPRWLLGVISSAGYWTGIQWGMGSDADEAERFDGEVDALCESEDLTEDEDGHPATVQDGRPFAEAVADLPSVKLFDDGRSPVKRPHEAEAISSQLINDTSQYRRQQHLLMLDIDHEIALIPSSTDGHYHLIINHHLDDAAWREIITVLGKHGVIEDGYAKASLRRGATFLRAPWVRKGQEEADRIAAYSAWLDEELDFTEQNYITPWRAEVAKREEATPPADPTPEPLPW